MTFWSGTNLTVAEAKVFSLNTKKNRELPERDERVSRQSHIGRHVRPREAMVERGKNDETDKSQR